MYIFLEVFLIQENDRLTNFYLLDIFIEIEPAIHFYPLFLRKKNFYLKVLGDFVKF